MRANPPRRRARCVPAPREGELFIGNLLLYHRDDEVDRPRAMGVSRSKVDGVALHAQHANLRTVDTRLPGKGDLNSHGAKPVHLNHLDDEVDSDQ